MKPKATFIATMIVGAFALYHMGFFTALGYHDKAWGIAIISTIACIILMKYEKRK